MNGMARSAGTWTRAAGRQTNHHSLWWLAGACALFGALAGSFLLGSASGTAPLQRDRHLIAAQHLRIADLRHEVAQFWTILHTPCQADASDQRLLQRLVAGGKYREASAVAEFTLSSAKKFCPDTRSALANLWQTASLDALESTPSLGPLDQTRIRSYQDIGAKSRQFGITPPDPLATFSVMYQAGVWQLARYTYVQALAQGLVSSSDLSSIDKYVATLRNQGHALAFHYQGGARATGLRLLATCAWISRLVQSPSGECAADLTQLLGPRWTSAVRPLGSDPVLRAVRASGAKR
jgi:hypothetical protein